MPYEPDQVNRENAPRSTPARYLFAFAAALAVVFVSARIDWSRRADLEATEYPTGLGDGAYYDPAVSMGTEPDIWAPNLKFTYQGEDHALYRRTFGGIEKDDGSMIAVAPESTGRYRVYTERAALEGETEVRFFLKVEEGAYIEFGDRKYQKDRELPPGH
ncbi:MAG: hypothetical protein R3F11_25375 [Verrucomicrobiales bacterium]